MGLFNTDMLIQVVRDSADKALEECATDLYEESKSRAPVGDTGKLVDSAYNRVDIELQTPDFRVREVGFDTRKDGKGFNYALLRHEVMPKNAGVNGGKTKFLENPYKERVEGYEKKVGEAVASSIGKGKFFSTISIGGK